MEADNLLDDLRGKEVDQSELERVIAAHFQNARGVTPRLIEYLYAGQDTPAITLCYDGDGELDAIYPGPALKPNTVVELREKIEGNLLAPTAPVIGTQILFAGVPTTGSFRYRDMFQIVPVPQEAPRPEQIMGDHPFMLQFQFPGSADAMIRVLRRTRIAREIELLCVALINQVDGSMGINLRHHWVIRQGAHINALTSEFCQELYTWPGAPDLAQGFLPVDAYPQAARVPSAEYYLRRGISPGQVVDLPDSIESSLDSFFALSRDERDRFLRASFWFQHVNRVFRYSQSASFTALVSAIEALMPKPENTGVCASCGKSTSPGRTAAFSNFLDQHAPTTPNSERRKFYSLRSALSHGGSLLHSDRVTWSPGLTPNHIS